MKLERIPEYLTVAVALVIGLIFAVFAGRYTASGQASLIATMLLMALAIAIVTGLRERIWVLIPLFWVLAGRIPVLPLPFSVRDLAVLFSFGAFLVLIALRVVRQKASYDSADMLTLALLLYLAIVFLRNPVGTYAMGSARVGGKPYLDVFIATLAYYVLARSFLPSGWGRHAPWLFSIGAWLQGALGVVTFYFPSTVPLIGPFYTGVNSDAYEAENIGSATAAVADRQTHFSFIASSTLLVLASYYRPLTLITPFYFWRFTFLALTAFAALKSGYRSVVIDAGLVFLAASYFRRGIGEMLRIISMAIPVVAALILLQGNVIQLPKAGQRALSFLPGKWDREAVSDAEGSTQWRLEMWREALTSNRYIQSKWLGDGFGYSLRDYEGMVRAQTWRLGGEQENAMVSGGFHSGPISTIRVVGYLGLGMFLVLLAMMSRKAVGLIRRAENTPLYPTALFICLLVVLEPLRFVVIFGAFDSSFPLAIVNLGLLKMLENSLKQIEKPLIPPKLEQRPAIRNRQPSYLPEPTAVQGHRSPLV